MRVFISYASEDRSLAEQVHLALTGAGHQTFFDKASLPAGNDYHLRILSAVKKSDAFVFLASPDSIREGSYALTELKYARENWPHPGGHVVPVRIRAVPLAQIPEYLKSVTVLEPEGNTAAEVLLAANEISQAKRKVRTNRIRVVSLLVLIATLGVAAVTNLEQLSGYFSSSDEPLEVEKPVDPKSAAPARGERTNLNFAQRSFVDITSMNGKPFQNSTQEAQHLLNLLGYPVGPADGFEGIKTTIVLEQFQREHNIPISGAADDPTLEVLRSRARKKFLAKDRQ